MASSPIYEPSGVAGDVSLHPPTTYDDDSSADTGADADVEPTCLTPREVVRLFQCRLCALPLRAPVALPCGRSLCKKCQPESRPREGVSFPGTPERLLGFECPFRECGVEHALADCAADVALGSVLDRGRAVLERHAAQGTGGAGGGRDQRRRSFDEALLSDYALLRGGHLKYDDDAGLAPSPKDDETPDSTEQPPVLVRLQQIVSGSLRPATPPDATTPNPRGSRQEVLADLAAAMRPEADCNVCYALFHDPVSTACGHTYCRACIHRSLDIHPSCPICRRSLSAQTYHRTNSSPSNELLARILESFWPAQVRARSGIAAAEKPDPSADSGIPIFVCTVSLPTMPTVLHVFETRYRLMIQRALQGDRTFGMVLPLNRKVRDGMPFTEVGTLLRIKNLRMFPDGRSLLEAVGVSRFKIVKYSVVDDYVVAKVERYDDVSIAEEEAIEAAETRRPPRTAPTLSDASSFTAGKATDASPPYSVAHGESPITYAALPPTETSTPRHLSYEEIDVLPTAALLSYARTASTAKLRRLTTPNRGPQPDDPALFPWWLASVLPTQESAKYRLLRAVSVRERLKMCCRWLVELEEGRGVGVRGEGYVFPWILLHTVIVFFSVLLVWFWGEVGADGI